MTKTMTKRRQEVLGTAEDAAGALGVSPEWVYSHETGRVPQRAWYRTLIELLTCDTSDRQYAVIDTRDQTKQSVGTVISLWRKLPVAVQICRSFRNKIGGHRTHWPVVWAVGLDTKAGDPMPWQDASELDDLEYEVFTTGTRGEKIVKPKHFSVAKVRRGAKVG